MPKIMITGSTGFLGSRLVSYYQGKYEVLPCTHHTLELCDAEAVRRFLRASAPDYLINGAAISDTGYAALHPEQAYRTNVESVETLARACGEYGVKLIYMSSDQVYNGCAGDMPHRENEPLQPQTVYAQQKLEMEQKAAAADPDAVGLRLTWLYDGEGKGILPNILRAAESGTPAAFSKREFRGVTYVWDLVERMEQILTLPGGVYNCGSDTEGSAYALACRIAHTAKAPAACIGCDEARYAEQARNIRMNSVKMEAAGIFFPDAMDGIERCLQRAGRG